jgi:hypothetical protein
MTVIITIIKNIVIRNYDYIHIDLRNIIIKLGFTTTHFNELQTFLGNYCNIYFLNNKHNLTNKIQKINLRNILE